MKTALVVFAVTFLVLAVSGCAPGPNQLSGSPGSDGQVAGFWKGLWHGFIVFFTFIVSLFNEKVRIYEVHNNGGWYNFGYLIGLMMFFGGGGGGACKGAGRR